MEARPPRTEPETTRAVRLHAYGEAPRIDEIRAPSDPGPGELIVDVAAFGVGAWDVGVAAGRLAKLLPCAAPPFTMGAELCGKVCALGGGIEGFEIGDRVMANPGLIGAWADRVLLRASDCGRAPRRASDAEAATIPVRSLAAWQGLERLGLSSGASLLIVGGGGAVGRAAVEIAHGRGLRVLTIAGPGELDTLRQLGAEVAVDYHEEWPPRIRSAASGDVDAALDLVGGESLEKALRLVRDGGRVVSTVASESGVEAPPGIAFELLKMKSSRAALDAIADLVDAGGLSTRIAGRYALQDTPAALDAARAPDREPGEIVLHR
ncbi:MAG: NADPH:quinone reductase-like Zn-dependent oxidoreductase [Halioglobus sp.]|jgi:NADPH:quinone reductase-like Zn-dependent oxidoreductase|uniref:NADP-dependent oxidoreductase n=1 Tax=Congregibacter sp. TaxID=2744308 RepID=UPI0039E58BBE